MPKRIKSRTDDGFQTLFKKDIESDLHNLKAAWLSPNSLDDEQQFRHLFTSQFCSASSFLECTNEVKNSLVMASKNLADSNQDMPEQARFGNMTVKLSSKWQEDHDKAARIMQLGFEVALEKIHGIHKRTDENALDEPQLAERPEASSVFGLSTAAAQHASESSEDARHLLADAIKGVRKLTRGLAVDKINMPKTQTPDVNAA